MRNYFRSIKFKYTLCVLAVLLLGLFVAAVSSGGTSPFSSALNYVLTPLNRAAAYLSETLSDWNAGFRSSARYIEEIESLKEEVEDYRQQLVEHEKLQQKLASYEDFLGVKSEHSDFVFEPAAVIMRDGMDIYASFTINKGTQDGIDVDMPVIYGKNLLGVVREVSLTSAVVYTVFHPDVSVSAYEMRTREDCYTEAENDLSAEGSIKLMGLARTTPVVAGGIVCTSGIGGIYPRDLIIGTVTQVMSSEADISAYAVVQPTVDPRTATDVFVITDFEDKAQ